LPNRFQNYSPKEISKGDPIMGLILTLILIMLLLAAVPAYPYSRTWGYGPSGLVGALLSIVIVLMLFSVIPWGFTPVAGPVVVPVD
jgi:hypothetical protein